MKKQLLIFATIIAFSEIIFVLAGQTIDPQTRTNLTLDSVNGGQTEQRLYETARPYVRIGLLAAYILIGVCWFLPIKKDEN